MVGEFRATLYDLFGYLLPGAVAGLAVVVLLHAWVSPHLEMDAAAVTQPLTVTVGLVTAYILGHLVQALGNAMQSLTGKDEFSAARIPPILEQAVRGRLAKRLELDTSGLSGTDIFALADEDNTRAEHVGDREVYVYREGFYRGMTISITLLALALVAHALIGELCVAGLAETPICGSRLQLCVGFLFGFSAAVGFWFRMKRFSRYRIQRTLYRFLVADTDTSERT